jgi:hypothetical protein
MQTRKAAIAAALAVGAIALVPGAASADAKPAHGTRAQAAGSTPPTLPGSVGTRIRRGENALDKAGEYIDKGLPANAVNSLRGARANMYAAWRSARYLIEHPPPPPAQAKLQAQASQSPLDGSLPVYATPEQTAAAVLNFQHDVVTTTFGQIDGAKGTLRDALSTTMFAAMDRRDAAITYIAAIPPPSGDTAPDPGYDVLMPAIVPDIQDEEAQGAEIIAGGALTPGEKRIVNKADAQAAATEARVNTLWAAQP